MSAPTQKLMSQKPLASWIFAQRWSRKYRERQRQACNLSKRQLRGVDSEQSLSKKQSAPIAVSPQHYDDHDLDPAQIRRINGKIQDSFYSMYEEDSLSISSYDTACHIKLETIESKEDSCARVESAQSTSSDYVYYYDDEKKQRALFYAELDLSEHDILNPNKRLVTLNYNHKVPSELLQALHRLLILLYYQIKQSSVTAVTPLQTLWSKLFNDIELYVVKKDRCSAPTICIVFDRGERPKHKSASRHHVLGMLYGVDLTILNNGIQHLADLMKLPLQLASPKNYERPSSLETISQHRKLFDYDSQQCWSMTDFVMPSLVNDKGQTSRDEARLFGSAHMKPKTAVFASFISVAATLGFRMIGAGRLGNE